MPSSASTTKSRPDRREEHRSGGTRRSPTRPTFWRRTYGVVSWAYADRVVPASPRRATPMARRWTRVPVESGASSPRRCRPRLTGPEPAAPVHGDTATTLSTTATASTAEYDPRDDRRDSNRCATRPPIIACFSPSTIITSCRPRRRTMRRVRRRDGRAGATPTNHPRARRRRRRRRPSSRPRGRPRARRSASARRSPRKVKNHHAVEQRQYDELGAATRRPGPVAAQAADDGNDQHEHQRGREHDRDGQDEAARQARRHCPRWSGACVPRAVRRNRRRPATSTTASAASRAHLQQPLIAQVTARRRTRKSIAMMMSAENATTASSGPPAGQPINAATMEPTARRPSSSSYCRQRGRRRRARRRRPRPMLSPRTPSVPPPSVRRPRG